MSEALAIDVTGLSKSFGGTRVVDDFDMAVPPGRIYGFLGPNGSGKTTTIRMLLDLARATSGEMRLFGESVPRRLPEVIDRVGAVVEAPKFSPHLSGRRNLMLLAGIIGVPATRVDEAVETVGLTGRDGDRFKAYSLGMKQRLAIAATLLKGPDLLILDEPTNCLDPGGGAGGGVLRRRPLHRARHRAVRRPTQPPWGRPPGARGPRRAAGRVRGHRYPERGGLPLHPVDRPAD